MNLVEKVRFRTQNEPLPKAKFLRVNQHRKKEIKKKKSITKRHTEHFNKKVVKKPSETENKELKVGNKR